jgi:hypothetical protein
VLATIFLGGCASIEVPGETKTDEKTRGGVIGHLKMVEHALYSCSTLRLRVTDTKVVMPFDGKKSQEKWTVLSCNGEHHTYDLTVLADGIREKGKIGVCSAVPPHGKSICSDR